MRFFKVNSFIQRYFYRFTWRLNPNEKTIYLSFDDGPHEIATAQVLDILKQYQIKATFFCVGENVNRFPLIMNRIVSEGHSIGNHTFNHLKGWSCPSKEYLKNVEMAEKSISTYTRTTLFRPPYGRIRKKQASEILKKGYKIIMWDILSYDYDKSINIDYCLKMISQKTRNGSIVVFHDSLKSMAQTSQLLGKYIENMKKRGFDFKVIEQC